MMIAKDDRWNEKQRLWEIKHSKFKSQISKKEVRMTSVDKQGSGVYPIAKGIKPNGALDNNV